MKKILIGIYALLFIVLSAAAQTPTKQSVLAEMEQVGNIHNLTLDYFYDQLNKGKAILSDSTLTNTDKINFINSELTKNTPLNPLSTLFSDVQKKDILISQLGISNSYLLQSLDPTALLDYSAITINSISFSSRALSYYDTLNNIIKKNENNITTLQSELNVFNDSVFQNFGISSDITLSLISGSSIAKASAEYWVNNNSKWATLKPYVYHPTLLQLEECCKTIIKADVAGAIGGAVGGAVTGVMVGGVGAVPGAAAGAVGGAIGGSVGVAVYQLLDWLWK